MTRRHEFEQYDSLLTEFHKEDQRGYKNDLRITRDLFQEIVEKSTPRLQKLSTFMREPLQVIICFLDTGNSYSSLQYSFRVEASSYPMCVKPSSRSTRMKYCVVPKLKRMRVVRRMEELMML